MVFALKSAKITCVTTTKLKENIFMKESLLNVFHIHIDKTLWLFKWRKLYNH